MNNQEHKKELIDDVKRNGKSFKGKTEYLNYLEKGKTLTRKQAIITLCYCCMGYYSDGGQDCEDLFCPLYPYMPFNKQKPKREIPIGFRKSSI